VNARRWLTPSLAVGLWMIFFVGLSCSPWRAQLVSGDGDAALHWKLGAWMLDQREVIRVDSFSHTRPHGTVISKEWLSELFWGAAGEALGWNGLALLAALLIATTLFLLQRQLEAEGSDALAATLLTLLAACTCSMHWLARPHLITHLLVVVFNWQLRAFQQDRMSGRMLFVWLVPLMALWANLHGAFPIGLVLIGLYLVGNIGRQPEQIRNMILMAMLFAACAAATLLNPNGWKLHAIIIQYLRHSQFVGGVNEFLPPNFHATNTHGFALQLLVLAVILMGIRGRWQRVDIVLVGAWCYFALHSVRNLPVFALVATPVLAEHLRGRLPQFSQRIAADGRIWMTVAVAAVALFQPPTVPSAAVFPVEAVKFLRAHPSAVRGRMFNPDHWGGYLLLTMPERPVFMDSRHEFYGTKLVADYLQVARGDPDWLETMGRYQVDWTLMPANHPLNQLLALRRDWRRVYSDSTATVFVRN
jgi:hypothetical protein